MRLLPVGHDHERCRSLEAAPQSDRCGYRRRSDERVPLQHLSSHPSGDPSRRRKSFGRRREDLMSNGDLSSANLSRRDVLATGAAAAGALVVGFWVPERANAQIIKPEGAAWAVEPATPEVNAWVVVAPDDTVTVRIAQTELGQGVWTSNAMMVCEELQCDWSKVKPQYASANRDAKEMAPAWTLEVMG